MDFLEKYKKYFVIGLAVVSLALMAYSSRDNYQPGPIERAFGYVVTNGQGFVMGIGDWFGDRIDFLVNMNDLHNINQQLQDEIWMMQIESARLTHVDEENRVLTELLNIHRRYSDYPILGANIIATEPTNWMDTFIINRGANDGVLRDMMVLAPGGLAGRVSKVGSNYSVVTSLVEDMSAVSAQSLRTGDWGVAQGDINLASGRLLRMEHIDPASDIVVGDEIVTSNISSMYPPGIHIGYVVEVGHMPNGMRTAVVQPSVDFTRLTTVLVVTELFVHELIDISTD